jgi:hypothetical protein
MTKILAAVVVAVLFLRWLAAARVMIPVDGFPVGVPALALVLAVAAVVALAAVAGIVALLVWQARAERAMAAARYGYRAPVRAWEGAR